MYCSSAGPTHRKEGGRCREDDAKVRRSPPAQIFGYEGAHLASVPHLDAPQCAAVGAGHDGLAAGLAVV
jgi:hypothetical protein